MFSEFSGSYYVGRLFVEPGEAAHAVMARDQHELVNRQLYASGEGIERTDLPLVMKLENRHLAVHGEAGVSANTLAVPETVIEETRIRNPPTLREVLLAKADRAAQLLEIARGEPGADAVPPAEPLDRFEYLPDEPNSGSDAWADDPADRGDEDERGGRDGWGGWGPGGPEGS